MTLERARSLAGRVVDERRVGIAGAELYLDWQDTLSNAERRIPVGARESREAVSDEDGFFVLEGIRAGPVRVSVSAAGFVIPEPRDLEVPAEGDTGDLTLVLKRGAVVTGTVTDSDDEPLTGVRISAGKRVAASDAEGSYRLEGVRPGPNRARADHPDYRRLTREIEIEPGENLLDWTLPRGTEVAGRVIDQARLGIRAAEVRLTSRRAFEPRTYRSRTSHDGSFLFATVARGDYTLEATATGHTTQTRSDAVVVAEEPIRDLEITLKPGVRLSGRILGLDFEELGRVRVSAVGRSTTRDAWVDHQGDYEITDLAAGSWLVVASLGGGRRQTQVRVLIEPGERDVRQDLELGGYVLSGRALLDGEALSGATVSIRGYETTSERSMTTDHRGSFRFSDLETGRYWLGLTHPWKLVVHNEVVEVTEDRQVEVDLRPIVVRGRVVEAESRREIADASVVLARYGAGQGHLGASTNAAGRFIIPQVNEGRYQVLVEKAGYAPLRQELEVVAGQKVEEQRFELTPTPGLDVLLSLSTGASPAGVKVMVSAADRGILLVEPRPVGADGILRLPKVPPGDWEILVSASHGALSTVRATVPGDSPAIILPPAGLLQVRIPELERSTAIADLSLRGANGEPLREIDLAARAFREHWKVVGGRVQVEAVPPGLWALRVEAPDGRVWSRTVATDGVPASVTIDP